jgi:hypothetical protein
VRNARWAALRVLPCVVLAAFAASCAETSGRVSDPLSYAAAILPKTYPACGKEISAFLRTLKLARQAGDAWEIYEPALQEMEDQMLDCVADAYPDPVPI